MDFPSRTLNLDNKRNHLEKKKETMPRKYIPLDYPAVPIYFLSSIKLMFTILFWLW
jgi:hypothetical protein